MKSHLGPVAAILIAVATLISTPAFQQFLAEIQVAIEAGQGGTP